MDPHPNLPINGHLTDTDVITKAEKKALKKNKKAISSLRISFANTYTVDAMIEATMDDAGEWPYGRIHLVMIGLYDTYRPKSRLDRTQMDRDKLTIKMAVGEHPDVLFEQAMMVRKKYRSRRTKPTWDELISCVVTGATSTYQSAFTVKMLDIDNEPNGQIVLTALKHLGSELYTGISLSRIRESDHETSLIQFNNNKNNSGNENENNSQVQWQQGMQCYWCWKLGHKVTNCPRKAAGDSKLPNPGGGDDNNNNNNTSGGGGNDDNNNNDDGNNNNGGGGKCGRCNGLHATKNCYHDPANALKRPDGWIVKEEFSEKELGLSSFSNYKPDFSIIAIDIAVDLSSNNNNNNNNVVSPDWKQHASTKQTIPFSVPNGENSSVESREQHGSFKTENDIDIDFEDDYIDLDNNSNNVDPDADANGNDTSSDGYITVDDNDYVHISNETDFEIEFEDDNNNHDNINNTSTDEHNSVGDNNNNDNNNDIEIEFDDDNNNDIEMNKIDPEAHADGDSTSSEDITVGEETSNDNHIIVGDNNRDNNNNNSNNANNSDNTSDDIIVGEMNKVDPDADADGNDTSSNRYYNTVGETKDTNGDEDIIVGETKEYDKYDNDNI